MRKRIVPLTIGILLWPWLAWAMPLYPVTVDAAGEMTVHRGVPRPPPTFLEMLFERAAEAAGFNMPGVGAIAYNWDNSICSNTGTYATLTVPRCIPGDGSFYLAFGMPSTPASAPSFTMAWDVNNNGADTTAAHHWCYRGSCAVVTAGGNANTIANLTFGTASTLADNQLTSPCNAANKACVGAATAAFTCTDNGTGSGCATTACNNHLTVIKVEPRTTSCTATVFTGSLDFGHFVLVEAN